VLVLDTGLSTIAPVERALAGLGPRARVRHLRPHDGPRYRAAAERLAEQGHGSHADELGTSSAGAAASVI
jgi:creatinine amidohydrolase